MPLDDTALANHTASGGYGASNPGYNAALQYYQGQYEPQLAGIDLQQSQAQNHLAGQQAQYALAQSQSGANANFANQDYSLGMERLGLQRNNIGVNADYYNQLLSNYGMDLSGTLGYQDTLKRLAEQLYGIQQQGVNQQSATATRNQISSSIPTGALQSKNNMLNLTDIKSNTANQLATLSQGYDTTLAGISEAKRQAQSQFEQRQLGIQHELKLNDNQSAMLDETAKELGLSRDKALSAIGQGLASMNLSNIISTQDLFDALDSGDFQRQQIADQIIRSATDSYNAGYFGGGAGYGVGGAGAAGGSAPSSRSKSSDTGTHTGTTGRGNQSTTIKSPSKPKSTAGDTRYSGRGN